MILVWYWFDTSLVLVWYWFGTGLILIFVCFLQASGYNNVLKAGKAEDLKNARFRRSARKAN